VTDGQTDGIAMAYTHYSIYAVAHENVAFQRTGSQVWYYQFTKGEGIQWSVDRTEELNCWNML